MTSVAPHSVAGVDVSRETYDDLQAYEALVRRWNTNINLVSKNTLSDLWTRHIADSAQLFSLCPPSATHWVDLGSGGGFPGLVVAVLAKQSRAELRVTLVESDLRKATFLRQAAQALSAPVTVLAKRIEDLPPLKADVLSARALAALPQLLLHANKHLQPDGTALFPKGMRFQDELALARAEWDFTVDLQSSLLDPDASILVIRNIRTHG